MDTAAWVPPPEFAAIAAYGAVPRDEMFRTFNMGVGMVLVVPADGADEAVRLAGAAGVDAWWLGEVRQGAGGVDLH